VPNLYQRMVLGHGSVTGPPWILASSVDTRLYGPYKPVMVASLLSSATASGHRPWVQHRRCWRPRLWPEASAAHGPPPGPQTAFRSEASHPSKLTKWAFLLLIFFVVDMFRHNKEDWAMVGLSLPKLDDADSIPPSAYFSQSGFFSIKHFWGHHAAGLIDDCCWLKVKILKV